MRILKGHQTVAFLLLVLLPSGLAMLPVDAPLPSTQADADPMQDPAMPSVVAPGMPSMAVPSQYRIEPAVPWRSVGPLDDAEFRCPEGNEDNIGSIFDPEVQVIRTSCPFRVIDEADLLGSPRLAVRHDDPNEMAFFSLHGAASSEGPTPRSRDPQNPAGSAQSHTTFTSPNEGWNWNDRPHGNEGFGEATSGIMSRDGNMFVAFLFSRPVGADENGVELFSYHFRLYKENTALENPGYRGFEIKARDPGNVIDEVNLVRVEPATQIETQEEYEHYIANETEEDNGTAAPSDDGDVGNYTIPRDAEDYSDDLIAAVWHEKAYDYENSPTGKSSWIDVVWTDASSRDDWHKMPDTQLVGPCRDASNPVAWNGRIYVACAVDAGYTGRRGAAIGDIDIWQFDLQDESKQLMSTIQGMQDGRPRLAANEAGRFVVTSSKEVGVEEPYENMRIETAWGWYGRIWDGGVYNVGGHFYNAWDVPIRYARITDMVLLDDQPVLYMVYMERANTTVRDPSVNPNGPPGAAAVEYHKAIAAFECQSGTPLALYDLQIGVARHPFEDGLAGDTTGVFDDLHDGLQVVREGGHPEGEELVYFAIGDHGVIQYGALAGSAIPTDRCSTGAALPVLFTPTPAVPAPLLVGSSAGIGTSTMLIAPAAVGFGSLLIAKRRAAIASAVKAKK